MATTSKGKIALSLNTALALEIGLLKVLSSIVSRLSVIKLKLFASYASADISNNILKFNCS